MQGNGGTPAAGSPHGCYILTYEGGGGMYLLAGLLLLTGVVPLAQALRANRHTTLRQPLLWAGIAWAVWTGSAWSHVLWPRQDVRLGHYVGFCLTGCAGVAVLGARRPGVGAWNIVVAGLLAVLLLPVLNGLGDLRLEPAHRLFLFVTLAVPLLNYMPTRFWPAVVFLGVGCALVMGVIDRTDPSAVVAQLAGMGLVSLSPWAAWACVRLRRNCGTEFDRLWLAYRDRYGFVWGQRMREQFNRSVGHAGWPVTLRWDGLRATSMDAAPASAELLATLRAVLKRFGLDEEQERPPAG